MNTTSRRSSDRTALTGVLVALLALAAIASDSFAIQGEPPPLPEPAPPAPSRPAARSGDDLREVPVILDLEAAVGQAELILAVRLEDVTQTRIVHGGRDERVTEQYRLEPVRVLKGIFAREALLMTGEDLGVYRFSEGPDRLERGQMLLVFLGQRGGKLFNCNLGCPTLAQSIPRLSGQDDPLLDAVEVLIAMTQLRDRAERVALLRDGLEEASGRGAVPLLLAMQRRALIAAQTPGAMAAVLSQVNRLERWPVFVEVAARTIAALLKADYLGQIELRREAALALVDALESAGPDYQARVALLDALGAVGQAAETVEPAANWLTTDRIAATIAERAAFLRALGRIGALGGRPAIPLFHHEQIRTSDRVDSIARALEDLPLDTPPGLEESAARALIQLDPRRAAELLTDRLVRKSEAGLGITADIARFGEFPPDLPLFALQETYPRNLATSALLEAFSRPLDDKEQLAFATAARKVADPKLVPALATLLDPRQGQVRRQAVEALIEIDTDEAAGALWPHLDEETDLGRKLQLIAFLARHGFRDGYAVAIEHLSQPDLREQAIEALDALDDPHAVPELRRIWATSRDLDWNAAAIRALARLGEADIAPRLREIAGDLSDPLAESALIALGDLGDACAVPMLEEGLASRSDAIAIASARATASLVLDRPDLKADGLRDRLAALLADPMASPAVRTAALTSLAALDDPRLGPALAESARDAALEGTELGARVEAELARCAVVLGLGD